MEVEMRDSPKHDIPVDSDSVNARNVAHPAASASGAMTKQGGYGSDEAAPTPASASPPAAELQTTGSGGEALGRLVRIAQTSKYALGVALIILVAIIWVAASQWIQYIFGSLDFSKPYFLTYFNTTGFALWNFGFLVSKDWRLVDRRLDSEFTAGVVNETTHLQTAAAFAQRAATPEDREAEATAASDGATTPSTGMVENVVAGVVGDVRCEQLVNGLYTWKKLARCALLFCPLWFLANVLFNYSLSMTSVASNTILSTTSSIWTLFLSKVALGSDVHPIKLIAVAFSIGGTAMVAFSDRSSSDSQKESLSGDILALVSAFFYAAYTTVLKWCLPDDERYFMGMVFGCVGLWNIIMFWPGLILLHLLGVEPFEFPSWQVLWPLVLNTLIGTNLSDVLWAKSVILTSPFVATLGLSLTTPLAMISDSILKGAHFNTMYICGAILVTVGFVVANLRN